MPVLPKEKEASLISSVEQAIGLTNTGMTPNEAIQKIAVAQQYGPEMTKRMVEAFNKSKSVHILKEADEAQRSGNFELADATTILANIYEKPLQQKTAEDFALPRSDFSEVDFHAPKLEKAAAQDLGDEQYANLTPESQLNLLEKHAALCTVMKRNLHDRTVGAKHELNKSLQKVAEQFQRMPKTQLHKVAQLVVNGYPQNGARLMKLLGNQTRRRIPELTKTAQAAVFPNKEPYLSISEIFVNAEKVAHAENDEAMFGKEADKGIQSVKDFMVEYTGKKKALTG
ncbi:MAG: hypothetical protein ACYTEQ_09355 [Planctomycetota bacterium]|jgi:hypothetical protein